MKNDIKTLMNLLKTKGFKSSIRLAIMIYLLLRGKTLFKELLETLETTPGNLWSHLEKLKEEGYIEIKYVIRNKPRTMIKITDKGIEETTKIIKTIITITNTEKQNTINNKQQANNIE